MMASLTRVHDGQLLCIIHTHNECHTVALHRSGGGVWGQGILDFKQDPIILKKEQTRRQTLTAVHACVQSSRWTKIIAWSSNHSWRAACYTVAGLSFWQVAGAISCHCVIHELMPRERTCAVQQTHQTAWPCPHRIEDLARLRHGMAIRCLYRPILGSMLN